MSFAPFENPIGFGVADFIAFGLTAMLIVAAVFWKPRLQPVFSWVANRPALACVILAALPIALRLALMRGHPVPSPDIYDEFGHLFVADTLRHFRLANPPHPLYRFFETFFILQHPTYSSIYPLGQGLALAFGRLLFGNPWVGVVISTAAFCSLTYWMLRAWVSAEWALAGGLIAALQFGPLSAWMNSYWGGSLGAAAGCLVFGALPRFKDSRAVRDAALLGAGLSLLFLIRPFEAVFVLIGVFVYTLRMLRSRALVVTGIILTLTGGLILLHNRSVTGKWTTLPYQLSQFQYGVPAALTVQADPVPHRELTPQQAMEYKSQVAFRGSEKETIQTFLLRLEYRVRYYRFFFLPPLYIALLFFLPALRESRFIWVSATIFLVAVGSNLFPAFQLHYFAPITCLFLLMAVVGLERLSRIRNGGAEAARVLVLLCILQFAFWYTMHLFDDRGFSQEARQYETWNGINHTGPERRIMVNRELAETPGKIVVFVRYSPTHPFQDEWVYNEADIDHARIIWARDLGEEENQELRVYYPDRKVFLLQPDFRPPRLEPY